MVLDPTWSGRLPRQTVQQQSPAHQPVLPRQRQSLVELAVEIVDSSTGVTHRQLLVDDGHGDSPTRSVLQAEFAAHDAVLKVHPEWAAPTVEAGVLRIRNPASEYFYASPTMREWRERLVPGAGALLPVQQPWIPALPSGSPVDAVAAAIYRDALDSIGVRTRAVVLQDVVRRRAAASTGSGRPTWVSLACGAAVPVLDAMDAVEGIGSRPRLVLVDIDDDALALAEGLTRQHGLRPEADVRFMKRDLISSLLVRTPLRAELGDRSAAVVEALGIFEYFRDASCVRLLKNAFELVRPGGVLVVANMLSDRRELQFNQRAIGWPLLVPRSVEQLVDLVRRAGLPLERTTVSIPQDGVYAVVDVVR